MIRILLADDHPVVRRGLRAMLEDTEDIEVVGEATGGLDAVQQVDRLEPSVVLMDVSFGDLDGIEATRQITRAHPNTSIIMLTVHDSEAYLVEAVRAGAAGYLTKDCSPELLQHAVRSIAGGGTLVRGDLLRRAVDGLVHHSGDRANGAALAARLTKRELEILRLVAQGHNNRTICRELFLAEVTVKKHVQNIIGKLGVSDRTQAAIIGVRLALNDETTAATVGTTPELTSPDVSARDLAEHQAGAQPPPRTVTPIGDARYEASLERSAVSPGRRRAWK